MKNKMYGSFYPYCNSQKTSFSKSQAYDGEIFICNRNLVFQRMILMCFRSKFRLELPLSDISRVETCSLNGFLPYGVCIYMKDGKEYMLGHAKNNSLKDFIMNAKSGMMPDISNDELARGYRKREFIGIIAIVLVILALLIGILVSRDFKQEDIVLDELATINNLDIENNDVDMNIKAKGDYGKVERAIKEYYQAFFAQKRLIDSNRAENLFNIFTPKYLQENKNKLKDLKLLEMINKKTKELEKSVDLIVNMLDEDEIMTYIAKYKLDDYYNDFYRDNMVSSQDAVFQAEWKELKASNTRKVGYLTRIVKLLIDHNNVWYIENDDIYFTDGKILDEYNNLYDLIYDNDDDTHDDMIV